MRLKSKYLRSKIDLCTYGLRVAFHIVLLMMAWTVRAQQPSHPSGHGTLESHRTWQFGGFVMGGFPPYYQVHALDYHYNEELDFYSAAFEGGRMLSAVHGRGVLKGQGEAMVEVLPFWLAHHPSQVDLLHDASGQIVGSLFPAFSYHGVSVTPLLFRWNFMKSESSRRVPFFQLGSGLLWTTKNFPQGQGDQPGDFTSQVNFTPQVGFGESLFTKKRQSLNVGVRAVHISSAGLGEYNPGVNVVVQFSLGYSWWR